MEEQKSMSQTVEQTGPGETEEQPVLSPDEEMVELEKLLSEEPDDFQARCRLHEADLGR